jgi:protocatechuate 3,4-dioxygenase alpha subunit
MTDIDRTPPTPSQTVGPFFAIGLRWLERPELVSAHDRRAVRIEGRVLDGRDQPVPDAVVEIFQADAKGAFPPHTEPGWSGFGRCGTDEQGRFHFVTVKPGPVTPDSAPHLDVSVFARGLLQRLVTRCYFGDEEAANATDPVLHALDRSVAATLIAPLHDGAYRFDVHLQGEQETAFFAW